MADKVKNIVLHIKSDVDKAAKDMRRVADNSDRAKKEIGEINKQGNKMISMAKKATGVFAAMFAVDKIVSFAKENAKLYDQQVKAETKLLTALKGREDIQRRLIRLAGELQRKTLYGDEQTIEAMSRLASIIGNNEDAIKRLIPLVQDLATNKQMDLASAAELVAKSVGSSTNALSRYGIEINGAVGSAERLESAVSALNEQVGGQAEAAAKVGLGPLQQLEMAWGDFREQIGRIIIESGTLQRTLSSLMDIVYKLTDAISVKEGIDEAEKNLEKIKDGYVAVFKEIEGGGMELTKITAKEWLSGEIDKLNDELENAKRKFMELADQAKLMSNQQLVISGTKRKLKEYGDEIERINSMIKVYQKYLEKGEQTPPPTEEYEDFTNAITDAAKTIEEDFYNIGLESVFDEMADQAEAAFEKIKEANEAAADEAYKAWWENWHQEMLDMFEKNADEYEKSIQKKKEIDRLEQQKADEKKKKEEKLFNARISMATAYSNILTDMSQLYEEDKEKMKAMQIAATMIQTYAAAVVAYKNGMEIGGPAGPILAVLQAAAAITFGLTQVKKIASYKKGGYTGRAKYPYRDADGPIAGVVHENEFVFDQAKTALLRPLFEDIQHDRLDVKALAALSQRKQFRPVVNTMSTDRVEKLLQGIYEKLPGVVDETVDYGDHIARRKGNMKWRIKK